MVFSRSDHNPYNNAHLDILYVTKFRQESQSAHFCVLPLHIVRDIDGVLTQ